METTFAVGKGIIRKDAVNKASGRVKFTGDVIVPGILHAKMVTSKYAHAIIRRIDVFEAAHASGVRAVVTGDDVKGVLTGTFIEDRPPIAAGKVRYFGEPVAVVVADSELEATRAAELIRVEYEPLPVLNDPGESVKPGAVLIHEGLANYRRIKQCFPEPDTNVANHVRIRKGDMAKGWAESAVTAEESFYIPQSDHIALEPRVVRAEIKSDGQVVIHTPSQAPYIIRKKLARHFGVDNGKITVHTPMVGGSFGGKAAVQLEIIAYLASRAAGGREVIISNTREEDMISSPCRIGLEARVKLGASRDGMLKAAEITYLVNCGAYSDMGAVMTKSIASDCTGPYDIENVSCDSMCVYTNHTYATSFRGFGHAEYTAAVERAMDKLADMLGMDPLVLRYNNAVMPGDTSPTQSELTRSNIGNLPECINRLKTLINWDEGRRIAIDGTKIRAKGAACFWKTSTTPPDAASGAVITFSPDGFANLSIGAVEIGQGTKTVLAQILAERLKLDPDRINVSMEVDTRDNPEHWKTVASSTTYMVGNAVVAAADDVIRQIRGIASIVLRCSPEDLEVEGGKVFIKSDEQKYLDITEVIHGYKYPNGNSVGGQIIGRGSFIMKHLSGMDKETGKGDPGPLWTVGAEAVEVELDTKDYTYRLLRAACVIDAGKVINPMLASSVTMGGMSMGLSLASREAFLYDNNGIMLNPNLRMYRTMRFGQNPEYLVEFLETPEIDGPYGARGLGEHGLIGMPGALANCLSAAIGADLDRLPLTPELLWKTKTGGVGA